MAKIPVQILDAVKKYKEKIKNLLSVKKVIIFGSYAKGNFSDDSDIDVCVIADNIKNNFLACLEIAPMCVGIDCRIEPVVFSAIEFEEDGEFGLLKEIKSSGIEI